ncbi:hypothetical protein SEPCBS119000_002819 [Sporothrix epigloea]|uniref:Glycosyltransferase family 31 protein n=1 Tax=Sporothrix epigloea TaxID=1892477 RepID=A0ABP0DK00_9PEZI
MLAAVESTALAVGAWITAVLLKAFQCIDWLDSTMLLKLGPKYRPVRRVLDAILTKIWNAAAICLNKLGPCLPGSFAVDYGHRTRCHWSRIRKVQYLLQNRRNTHASASEEWQLASSAPLNSPHSFGASFSNVTSRLDLTALQDLITTYKARDAVAAAAEYLNRGLLRAFYCFVLVLSGVFYFGKLILFRSVRRVRYLAILLTLVSFSIIMFRKHPEQLKAVKITLGSKAVAGATAEGDPTTKTTEAMSDVDVATAVINQQNPKAASTRFNDEDLTSWVNFLVDKHHLGSDFKYQAVQLAPLFDAETVNGKAQYPTADRPIDDLTPSLNVMNQDLVASHFGFRPSNRGFQDIHMPGRAAIRADERHARLQALNDYGEVDRKGYRGKTKTEIRKMIEMEERIRSEIADTEEVAKKIAQALEGVGDGSEVPAWFDGLRVYRYKNDHLQAYSLPFPDEVVEEFVDTVSEEDRKLFDELNNGILDPEPDATSVDDIPAQVSPQNTAEVFFDPVAPATNISEIKKRMAAQPAVARIGESIVNQYGDEGGDLSNQFRALVAQLESYINSAETNRKTKIAVPISFDTTGSKTLDKIAAQDIVVTYGNSSLITITTNSTAVAVADGDVKFVVTAGSLQLINETPKEVSVDSFLSAPEPVDEKTGQPVERKIKKNTGDDKRHKKDPPAKMTAVLPSVAASMSHLTLPRGVIHVPVSGRGFAQNIEPPAAPLWTEIAGGMKSKNGKPFLRSQYKRLPERKSGEPPLLPNVPKGVSVDASGLMVGISTTYSRLHNNDFAAIDDWARWLADGKGQSNGAFLYLVLHRPRNNETNTVRDLLTERGIFFDIVEDWGHEEEGVGGGPEDVHPLPIVPDADSIRYANLLDWMRAYCHDNFGEGRPKVLHEATINDSDGTMYKKDRKMLQPDKWDMLVYALLDDDIFVPDMGRLVAKLQEHRGLPTGYDPRVGRSPDETQLDTDMWLGFPSDPWSDWTFHNGTTLHEQSEWEQATYGNATTTKLLDDRFVHPDVSTYLPSAYGGGAMFMFVDLAHQMADLACMRRSKGDNIINTVFKANRAAFYRGEHLEASWDEQLYRCTAQNLPDVRLRLVPSYYAPSDAAVYGTEWESAMMHNTFGKHLARLTQYNGGTHPMVMHNHRTWHNFDVGAAHQVADVCGKDGFLQRFAFADGWVLTNGYSLTHYDDLRTVKLEYHPGFEGSDFANLGDQQEMKTPSMLERFRVHQEQRQYHDQLHMVLEYPTRPRDAQALDWTGQQQTYRLIETTVAQDGTVLQAYLRPAATPLRDLTAIGGRKHFKEAQGRMAVPLEALVGLDGSDADRATEAPAPDQDELFVVVWQPPGDDVAPDARV